MHILWKLSSLILALCFLVGLGSAEAQDDTDLQEVSGIVTSAENGESIPAVNVRVKGMRPIGYAMITGEQHIGKLATKIMAFKLAIE